MEIYLVGKILRGTDTSLILECLEIARSQIFGPNPTKKKPLKQYFKYKKMSMGTGKGRASKLTRNVQSTPAACAADLFFSYSQPK